MLRPLSSISTFTTSSTTTVLDRFVVDNGDGSTSLRFLSVVGVPGDDPTKVVESEGLGEGTLKLAKDLKSAVNRTYAIHFHQFQTHPTERAKTYRVRPTCVWPPHRFQLLCHLGVYRWGHGPFPRLSHPIVLNGDLENVSVDRDDFRLQSIVNNTPGLNSLEGTPYPGTSRGCNPLLSVRPHSTPITPPSPPLSACFEDSSTTLSGPYAWRRDARQSVGCISRDTRTRGLGASVRRLTGRGIRGRGKGGERRRGVGRNGCIGIGPCSLFGRCGCSGSI